MTNEEETEKHHPAPRRRLNQARGPMSKLTIAAVVIQLIGSLCTTLRLTLFGIRHPRLVQATPWLLWAISGLVAVAAVATAAIALAAGNTSITLFMNLFLAALMAYAAIALLGLYGFWAALAFLHTGQLVPTDDLTDPPPFTDSQWGRP